MSLHSSSSTLVADPIVAQSSIGGLLLSSPENPDGTDATELVN